VTAHVWIIAAVVAVLGAVFHLFGPLWMALTVVSAVVTLAAIILVGGGANSRADDKRHN
jgi:hypothetical protein